MQSYSLCRSVYKHYRSYKGILTSSWKWKYSYEYQIMLLETCKTRFKIVLKYRVMSEQPLYSVISAIVKSMYGAPSPQAL